MSSIGIRLYTPNNEQMFVEARDDGTASGSKRNFVIEQIRFAELESSNGQQVAIRETLGYVQDFKRNLNAWWLVAAAAEAVAKKMDAEKEEENVTDTDEQSRSSVVYRRI